MIPLGTGWLSSGSSSQLGSGQGRQQRASRGCVAQRKRPQALIGMLTRLCDQGVVRESR